MGRLDKLRSQWSDSLLLSLYGVPDGFSDAGAIFECCVSADPTPTHKYVGWILKSWSASCFHYEDICMGSSSRIADQLKRFELYKGLLPSDMRSLMKYQSPGHLDAALNSVGAPFSLVSGKALKRDAYILGCMQSLSYDVIDESGNSFKLMVPLTVLSSLVLGRDTRWCTAGTSRNLFLSYTCKGSTFNPLYILEFSDGSKYQFHWGYPRKEHFSFMDALDVKVSPDSFSLPTKAAVSCKLIASGLRNENDLTFSWCCSQTGVLRVPDNACETYSVNRLSFSLKTKMKCFSIYKRWFNFGCVEAYHEEGSLLTKRYLDSFDGSYSLERYILDMSRLLYIRGICGFTSKDFSSVDILNLFSLIEFRDVDILYLKDAALVGRRDILDLDVALDDCIRQPSFDKDMFFRCLIPYLICFLGSDNGNLASVDRLGIHLPLSVFSLKSLVSLSCSPEVKPSLVYLVVKQGFVSLVSRRVVVLDKEINLYGDNFLLYFEFFMYDYGECGGPYLFLDLFSSSPMSNLDIQSFSRCLVLSTYTSLMGLSLKSMSSLGFYNCFIGLCNEVSGFIEASGFPHDDIFMGCLEAFECVTSLLDSRNLLYLWTLLFLYTLTHGKSIPEVCECFADELTRRRPEVLRRSSQLLTEMVIDVVNLNRFYGLLDCIAWRPLDLVELAFPRYPRNPVLCFLSNNQMSRLPSQTYDFLKGLLVYRESRCQVSTVVAANCLHEMDCYGADAHGYSLEVLYNGEYSNADIASILSLYISFIEKELNFFPSILRGLPLVRETLEVVSA